MANENDTIKELTLLLLWLTSWREKIGSFESVRSWKGYDFAILNELAEEGMISDSKRSKSTDLTPEGVEKAKQLERKYLKTE